MAWQKDLLMESLNALHADEVAASCDGRTQPVDS